MNLNDKKIAIIGLGYVGLPLALEFGKSLSTLGFDTNKERIKELIAGFDKTLEADQESLLAASLLSYSHHQEELDNCDVFIVTVPTPIDNANRPNLEPLIKASEMVGMYLKKGRVVIYESTVFPGCTEEVCVPILEQVSGLKFNQDFYCGYSPERINPGDKVNTLTTIKKITSGSTPEISQAIDELYKGIITAGTFKATSIKVAEAAKVIENTQRDLNIALVNELSVIFNRLNIDTLDVLEAAGSKWNFLPFRPGMVGGHCIGVDPYYLTHKAEQLGYHPQVILAGRRINDDMSRYAAQQLIQKMSNNGINIAASRVGLLGITFKENCPDIRNSKVKDLMDELVQWNVEVIAIDPWADPKITNSEYGIELHNLDQGNTLSLDALIVAVGHNEFRALNAKYLRSMCTGKKPVIADLKSIYDRSALQDQGFSVFRL